MCLCSLHSAMCTNTRDKYANEKQRFLYIHFFLLYFCCFFRKLLHRFVAFRSQYRQHSARCSRYSPRMIFFSLQTNQMQCDMCKRFVVAQRTNRTRAHILYNLRSKCIKRLNITLKTDCLCRLFAVCVSKTNIQSHHRSTSHSF